ncbi:MAG: MFS transporter [Ignavibacteriaceae bacterium]|mgnify:CR=1 FL=1|jgi:Arabinose efflux permease|nr:MAG: MFS transporter [Chlorobiota bacterium]KXK04135.1 MAG: Major facilitator superfamily permease [Chlorobi bacterium OLB4]MBV6397881.1 Tetracycline resistance protein, class C [Ignavibacteria bacterium]MCC6886828.1 MFS transporter [Ignavibacteriales bacterium]MCE7953952.1 MFS transporter [Chlorobi bacterium CHB7]MEB2330604.1 MFS transporter [Ignavibacteriaceae bacterium]OQY76752.1 MAG: hypothetical protein B6D43_08980 [Ignavibacteriales bacterium UTCHB1]RIK47686.1 MAG: hypothetical prot
MIGWKRNLYIIWIAQFIAMIGMSMVIPFLPFYIRELGVTDPTELEKWSGLVFAGPFVLSFVMTPVWGALGDKFGKKPMVVRAIFGLALSQLLLGLATDVFQLLLFRMFQGAVSGFIAASLALIASVTPKEKSGYALGMLQTSIAAGTIIGPVIGGLLADIISVSNIFFITSVMCFSSGILIIFLVDKGSTMVQNSSYTVIDNIKYSFSSPRLIIPLISIFFVQVALMMTMPVFALYIESFKINTEYISTITGTIFGVMGLFTVISSPWWGKKNDASGIRRNIIIAMSGAGIALILHSVVLNAIMLYPLRAILGFFVGGIIPAFYSYLNKNTGEDRKGGIMGIASSFTLLGNLVGPLTCTALTGYISLSFIFTISGFLLIANSLFVYLKLTDIRKLKISKDEEVILIPLDNKL